MINAIARIFDGFIRFLVRVFRLVTDYNVRNMKLRKGLTLMTAMGIALTVTTAIFIMALLAGLNKAFATSGNPLNVLVLRKGSTSELTGPFPADNFQVLKTLPGIANDSHGEPLVSGEITVVI